MSKQRANQHTARYLAHRSDQLSRWQRGQALIEYVLILVLAFIGLIAILLITAPAVGNVFSNTVYNLLGQTTTPQEPLSAQDFWNMVTAVASYTPQAPRLITNTPPLPTPVPSNAPTNTATPITATPTSSITPTPGPSPTPQDTEFLPPFYDGGTNPDSFQDDFLDLFANAGPWDAEYWDAAGTSAGDCNLGSDPFFDANGVPQRAAKSTNQVPKIDFPNASAPTGYWRTLTDRPYPGVETEFCARFQVNINLPATTYTFKYRKDDGVRIFMISGSTTEKVVDSWTGVTTNWVTKDWTNTTSGLKTVRIIFRDTGSNAELKVRLYRGGQTSDDNCTWQLANERFKSSPTSWDDSPFANYQNSQYCVLRLRGYINLQGTNDPILEFYHAYELHNFDKISVGISIYESGLWNDVLLRTGSDTNFAFSRERFELKSFTGSMGTVDYRNQRIELRFVLETDSSNTRNGWWIDDIRLQENFERVYYIGFGDDVEGDQFWVPGGTWARSGEKVRSGMSAWTDSPGTNYVSNSNTTLELDGRLDLLNSNTIRPEIVFWNSWDLNTGDAIFLELSTDRNTWTALRTGPTDTTDYLEQATSEPQFVQTRVEIPTSYWALNRIYVRFRLYANNDSNVKSGWWIDDIEFRNKAFDSIQPTWCDSMEEGIQSWLPTGSWTQTTLTAKDGLHSWTDSPGGDYVHGSNTYLELLPYIDLSNPALTRPIVEFWHRWDINDSGASNDRLYVEISTDDGNVWTPVWVYASDAAGSSIPPGFGSSIPKADYSYNKNTAWTREVIELSPWLGVPSGPTQVGLRLRFRLDARSGWRVGDGWYIDAFCLRRANNNTITLPFADDLEVGNGNWLPSGGWTLSTEQRYSGQYAFSDSPGSSYQHDSFHILELRPTINLSGTTKPTLYYWERYNLANDDRLMVHIQEVNADGSPRGNWEYRPESNHYRVSNLGWARTAVDLRPYIGKYIRIRWELDALENSAIADGAWLDQISIINRTDEIQYRADPYYEDIETLAPGEWVFGHKWDTVAMFRNLGSGGSLGPGQWTTTWYDGVSNACSSSANLTNQVGITTVDEINFDWGTGFPAGTGITAGDTFGAIFRRTFVFLQDTQFTFTGQADDGLRVYDNGVLVFSHQWNSCGSATFNSSPYTFTAGTHNVEVRYYESTVSAKVVFGFAGNSLVFHDSPTGNYENTTATQVELEGEISLIGLTDPALLWEHRYNIASGDAIRVQVSIDEGFNWFTLISLSGTITDWNWTQYFVDLRPYRGNKIVLRFQLTTNSSSVADGWWIDNIRIIE